jgi:predicted amidophosphoribosyltransferase
LQQEAAVAQAQVAADQVRDKARQTDQTAGMNMAAPQLAVCPHCNARVSGGGKFCEACGQPFATQTNCAKCSAPMSASARFCASCGSPRG